MIFNRSERFVPVQNYLAEQSADVQMSDWREVRCLTRDAWKSDTMESGELSAMIISTTLMLVLSATVLDSGQHRAVLLPILHKQAVREAATICPRPCKLTFEFDLESGVQVTCDVAYLCANLSLPRPLCSRLRPNVRNRQIDRRQTRIIA